MHDSAFDLIFGISQLERVLAQAKHPFLLSAGKARLAVAYSGGRDSLALLLIAEAWQQQAPAEREILALHVHHGLSPHADAWATTCEQVCTQLGIPLQVLRVQVAQTGQGVEASARQARYQAILNALAEAQIGVFCTAHHQQDQAETFLLQAMRGAGVAGLGGMRAVQDCRHWQSTLAAKMSPETRGGLANRWHLRPLLDWPADRLAALAAHSGLPWVDDESNQDLHYRRNFLRQDVLPRLAQQVPSVATTLARSAAHCQMVDALTQELARADWEAIKIQSAIKAENQAPSLAIEEVTELALDSLLSLSPLRQQNVLRYWLIQQLDEPPSTGHWEAIWQQAQIFLETGAPMPLQFDLPQATLLAYRGRLSIERRSVCQAKDAIIRGQSYPLVVDWSVMPALMRVVSPTGVLLGEWELQAVEEAGQAGISRQAFDQPLYVTWPDEPGNARYALHPRRPAKTYKQWCQEAGIHAVRRQQLPWLYVGSERQSSLLSIGGLGLLMSSCVSVGERYALVWRD